jgi:hypothetical protein
LVRWVLTADACYSPSTVLGRLIVVAGKRNILAGAATEQIAGVDDNRVVRLPTEGLVLLRLNTTLTFNADFVNSMRLQPDIPLQEATFMGWPNRLILRNILQRAVFPIMPNADCERLHGDRFRSHNICTGPFTGGRSTCEGNLGGPLFKGSPKQEVLVGILVNHPANCGQPNQATGIYVNTQQFINWINENTRL